MNGPHFECITESLLVATWSGPQIDHIVGEASNFIFAAIKKLKKCKKKPLSMSPPKHQRRSFVKHWNTYKLKAVIDFSHGPTDVKIRAKINIYIHPKL